MASYREYIVLDEGDDTCQCGGVSTSILLAMIVFRNIVHWRALVVICKEIVLYVR